MVAFFLNSSLSKITKRARLGKSQATILVRRDWVARRRPRRSLTQPGLRLAREAAAAAAAAEQLEAWGALDGPALAVLRRGALRRLRPGHPSGHVGAKNRRSEVCWELDRSVVVYFCRTLG